jgi:hypothetical protein
MHLFLHLLATLRPFQSASIVLANILRSDSSRHQPVAIFQSLTSIFPAPSGINTNISNSSNSINSNSISDVTTVVMHGMAQNWLDIATSMLIAWATTMFDAFDASTISSTRLRTGVTTQQQLCRPSSQGSQCIP